MTRARLGEDRFQVVPDRIGTNAIRVRDLLRVQAFDKPRRYSELGRRQLKHLLEGLGIEGSVLTRIADEQKPTGSLKYIRRPANDRMGMNNERELIRALKQGGGDGVPAPLAQRLGAGIYKLLQGLAVLAVIRTKT